MSWAWSPCSRRRMGPTAAARSRAAARSNGSCWTRPSSRVDRRNPELAVSPGKPEVPGQTTASEGVSGGAMVATVTGNDEDVRGGSERGRTTTRTPGGARASRRRQPVRAGPAGTVPELGEDNREYQRKGHNDRGAFEAGVTGRSPRSSSPPRRGRHHEGERPRTWGRSKSSSAGGGARRPRRAPVLMATGSSPEEPKGRLQVRLAQHRPTLVIPSPAVKPPRELPRRQVTRAGLRAPRARARIPLERRRP